MEQDKALVVGIDFAAQPANTWAAVGRSEGAHLVVTEIVHPIKDEDVVFQIESGPAVVAIDIPFGWPEAFVSFVSQHHYKKSATEADTPAFSYRRTDQFVRAKTRKTPLSVSTDKIGIAARRMACLISRLRRCEIVPFSSNGSRTKVIEVYPAATLAAFGLSEPGYSSRLAQKRDSSAAARRRLISELSNLGLRTTDAVKASCENSGDALDAAICAFTAHLYLSGSTWAVPDDEVIRREGWIFFPKTEL